MSQLKRARAAQASLSAEAFQQLVATMEARGYRLEGERFVEHDSFGTREARLNLGQNDAQAQMSEGDEALIRQTFGNLGMPHRTGNRRMLFAHAWMEALSFRKRHNRWRNTWQTQPTRISKRRSGQLGSWPVPKAR